MRVILLITKKKKIPDIMVSSISNSYFVFKLVDTPVFFFCILDCFFFFSFGVLFLLGDKDELNGVKSRTVQRFPIPGEPVCVMCGKFGEYICDEVR